MKPSNFWTSLVQSTQAQMRVPYERAWLLTSKTHPEAATLMAAYGATRQTVGFFNSRIASTAAAPSKAAARREFREKVDARMKETGVDYDSAFNFCQRHHPDLAAVMDGRSTPAFSNANPDPAKHLAELAANVSTGAAPLASPQTKKMLRLPMDATQDQFEAALAGNGGEFVPFNPGKIFAALVELEQKTNPTDYETAIRNVKVRCPELWSEVQAIAGK